MTRALHCRLGRRPPRFLPGRRQPDLGPFPRPRLAVLLTLLAGSVPFLAGTTLPFAARLTFAVLGVCVVAWATTRLNPAYVAVAGAAVVVVAGAATACTSS